MSFATPKSPVSVHCPECGYSLYGIPEGRCPECGFGYNRPGVRSLSLWESQRSLELSRRVITLAAVAAACAVSHLAPHAGVTLAAVVWAAWITGRVAPPAPAATLTLSHLAWVYKPGLCLAITALFLGIPVSARLGAVLFAALAWGACLGGPAARNYADLNLPADIRGRLRLHRVLAAGLLLMATLLTVVDLAR